MKKIIILLSSLVILAFLLPVIIVSIWQGGLLLQKATEKASSPHTIKSYIVSAQKVEEFNLEEYLPGVLAAEMPASFPEEALKAQAVAARTYIANRVQSPIKSEEHFGADICTNPAHCKAWCSKEEALAKWSATDGEKNWQKLVTAAEQTKGEIMLWEDKPVSAVFYAISSGRTESAKDVWGSDIPYLQSVGSPEDVNAPGYESTAEFSTKDFRDRILSSALADLNVPPEKWIGESTRTEGGSVAQIIIGGKAFKGMEIRSLFGLRSHNFKLEYRDEKFIFTVKGYGHGVGMSQWGAKFLADEGKSYREILLTYYKNVDIKS